MDQKPNNPQPLVTETRSRQPNEQGQLNIDEFLRISDPETQQVFVEQRA